MLKNCYFKIKTNGEEGLISRSDTENLRPECNRKIAYGLVYITWLVNFVLVTACTRNCC